jgi:ABC-2 type transport system permease protein
MNRVLHLIRKEFRQTFRNRPMLVLIFIVPIFQLLILAYAVTTETKHVKLLIADGDNSHTSREIARAFSNTDRFDLKGYTSDLAGVREQIQAWRAQMVLVIPPDFGRDVRRGLTPSVQVIVDGVDGNSAGVAMGYAWGILTDLGLDLVRTTPAALHLPSLRLVTMEERMWYNPNLSSQQYMVPGIVVLLLTILPMMLTGISLVREKELGTLEQLMVTPLKKHQLLLGKLIPFLILSYIELAIVMTVAVLLFRINMQGSYPLLAGLSLLYLFTTLGLGIFVSTVAHSQQQAMFVAWFLMVFMTLMNGFFIPIENMPRVMQLLTYLNPMRYFLAIIRDIFSKGSALPFLLKDAIPMTAYGVVIMLFSVAKFQKRAG